MGSFCLSNFADMGLNKVFRDHYLPCSCRKSIFVYKKKNTIKGWINDTQHYGTINRPRSYDGRFAFEARFRFIVGYDGSVACYGLRVVANDRHSGIITAYPIRKLPRGPTICYKVDVDKLNAVKVVVN